MWPHVDLSWHSASQDLVLFLQELDMSCEFAIGNRGNQCQEWVT